MFCFSCDALNKRQLSSLFMAQVQHGIRHLFAIPSIYEAFQGMIGANKLRRKLVQEYMDLEGRELVLDLGCGPGSVLNSLPIGVRYVGVDLSEAYIETAKRRFGGRGDFVCVAGEQMEPHPFAGKFDRVIALGLLHHLDDDQATAVLRSADKHLRSGGIFLAVDPVYHQGQSRLVRFVVSKDRGLNVRSMEESQTLAARVFAEASTELRHDLINIPYSHCITICRKS